MTTIPDTPEADPTPTTPYVFIDVDGVLNALVVPEEPHVHRLLWVPTDGYSYPIHIRERVLDWLRRLAQDHDVRWATTWQEHANEILAPAFDLPELPIACRDDVGHGFSASHGGWKLAGVIATVAEDRRPFVWIDDDAIPHDVDDHFAALNVPYLCVRPDNALGLSDDQIEEIEQFLAQHRGAAPDT